MSIPYEQTQAPEGDARAAVPHPLWCRPITISLGERGWANGGASFDVAHDGRTSGDLTFGEVMELIIAILRPCANARPLQWLKTPAEIAAREELSRQNQKRRAAEDAAHVHLTLTTEMAESIVLGLADVLCWLDGFNAARQDGSGPSGIEGLRAIKSHIEKRLMAKKQENVL